MELSTTREVIEALGGFQAVADRFGVPYQRVWKWGDAERFPAKTYRALQDALRDGGYDAPDSLWKMM